MRAEHVTPEHREADELIQSMYLGRIGWAARERAHELKLRAVFATVRGDAGVSAALHRLIQELEGRGRLVAIEPVLQSLGPQPGNTGLDALLHFARFHEGWLSAPEEWIPDREDARGQVGSLARHLFARYPLPGFLDAAWLSGFSELAEAYREWFVHLGRGDKLEAIHFPLPMTHRAAHYFLLAPEEFTVVAAMRFGQIRALGGTEALARAVAETFLADLQPDEAFWLSVIHFFANHRELPISQVGPVADYVRFRKFGSSGDDAPEPNFTMKGRTVDALLKRMAEWHEALARLGKKGRQSWSPSGIAPLDQVQKDPLSTGTCHWRIVEITNTLALAEEGRAMRHCVRSYQDTCVKGATSIWSLRVTLSGSPTMRRLLTIEVNNQRRSIVQVRGNCNQPLAAMHGHRRMMLAREVLRAWARQGSLGISASI
jgi:PcfJ-like protein